MILPPTTGTKNAADQLKTPKMHHPMCGWHIILLIVAKGMGDPSAADKSVVKE
jgi:hypothetical protein